MPTLWTGTGVSEAWGCEMLISERSEARLVTFRHPRLIIPLMIYEAGQNRYGCFMVILTMDSDQQFYILMTDQTYKLI